MITVFWKLVLTSQYTFLEGPDQSRQILPWLNAQAFALRHFSLLLWDPYESAGQSLIGQVQPAVVSPFTWLLALAPLTADGHIQVAWVNVWFVFLHLVGAWFAYALFRDLECPEWAAATGAVFYATSGYIGNIGWPQILGAAVWTPLVFLFLLRSLRGRKPLRNAAWAGVMLGMSWLGGHHLPSTYLTLAAFGVGFYYVAARPGMRLALARRLAVVFALLCLVSAAQTLPAIEYGKRSLRWTQTGAHQWADRVALPEHEDLGLKPMELIHMVVPGGSGLFADPFVGCVGLSLALLAVVLRFRRPEVRLFGVLGICGLLVSMPKNDVFYGWLYALVPVVERAREPMEAFAIAQFSLAVLAAIGASALLAASEHALRQGRWIIQLLLGFGGLTLGLFYLRFYLNTPIGLVDGDGRVAVIAILALLAAGILHAATRGFVSRPGALGLLLALLVVEQGNEVGYWNFVHESDTQHAVFLKVLRETEDLGKFLAREPSPRRVEWNRKDLDAGFGDWNRIESMAPSGASAPAAFQTLEPWSDRVTQLFGVGYSIGRAPLHPNEREIFSDPAGFKVFLNPDAFPRAWTVHQVRSAATEEEALRLTAHDAVDLRSTAVITGAEAGLETCADPDGVDAAIERPQSSSVSVRMACRGLLVVSDNWYPGWQARVDGKGAEILRVDGSIRGIRLERGLHRVEMTYRPWSVYGGLLLLALAWAAAVYLQRRAEPDGGDAIGEILSSHTGRGLRNQLTGGIDADIA